MEKIFLVFATVSKHTNVGFMTPEMAPALSPEVAAAVAAPASAETAFVHEETFVPTLSWSDRPGHQQHPFHRLRRVHPHRRRVADRARADLSAARVGRARSGGDLAQHPDGHRRRVAQRRPEAARSRCHRHHQPARDDGRLGSANGRAALQRARVAGHARHGVPAEVHGASGLRVLSRVAPGCRCPAISAA